MLQRRKAFYLKQYHGSSLCYEQAVVQQEDARLVQGAALTEAAEALYPAYILAGNSSIASGDHQRAIRMYRKADSLLLLPAATKRPMLPSTKKELPVYLTGSHPCGSRQPVGRQGGL